MNQIVVDMWFPWITMIITTTTTTTTWNWFHLRPLWWDQSYRQWDYCHHRPWPTPRSLPSLRIAIPKNHPYSPWMPSQSLPWKTTARYKVTCPVVIVPCSHSTRRSVHTKMIDIHIRIPMKPHDHHHPYRRDVNSFRNPIVSNGNLHRPNHPRNDHQQKKKKNNNNNNTMLYRYCHHPPPQHCWMHPWEKRLSLWYHMRRRKCPLCHPLEWWRTTSRDCRPCPVWSSQHHWPHDQKRIVWNCLRPQYHHPPIETTNGSIQCPRFHWNYYHHLHPNNIIIVGYHHPPNRTITHLCDHSQPKPFMNTWRHYCIMPHHHHHHHQNSHRNNNKCHPCWHPEHNCIYCTDNHHDERWYRTIIIIVGPIPIRRTFNNGRLYWCVPWRENCFWPDHVHCSMPLGLPSPIPFPTVQGITIMLPPRCFGSPRNHLPNMVRPRGRTIVWHFGIVWPMPHHPRSIGWWDPLGWTHHIWNQYIEYRIWW